MQIEKGPDLFGAWADNVPGIYGEGETVQETKENLLASIELYKKHNSTVPKELQGEISVEWTFSIVTLSFPIIKSSFQTYREKGELIQAPYP